MRDLRFIIGFAVLLACEFVVGLIFNIPAAWLFGSGAVAYTAGWLVRDAERLFEKSK